MCAVSSEVAASPASEKKPQIVKTRRKATTSGRSLRAMGAEAYNAPAMHREPLREFTLKAVLSGILLGILFGAANAYLGLRVGLTISASIPAAVMTVAVFSALRRPGTILEANLSQTIGSASTSLASGTIFTIPALYLWGLTPPYLQVVALCFLGGVLGIAAMIPLRRLLIVRSHGEL